MAHAAAHLTLTPDETARILGVRKLHVLRLIKGGHLRRLPTGIDPQSVEDYREATRVPDYYVSSKDAADSLGISSRHITRLVRLGVLKGKALPQSLGGTRVDPTALFDVDHLKLAEAGVKVWPPMGYVTSAGACRILGRGRSGLQALVLQGRIARTSYPGMNDWYSEEDVRAVAENRR